MSPGVLSSVHAARTSSRIPICAARIRRPVDVGPREAGIFVPIFAGLSISCAESPE
jgi:hypothetical protein